MKKLFLLCSVALMFSLQLSAAALPLSYFDGGQNLNAGQRKGSDKVLVQVLNDMDTAISGKASYTEATFSATFDQSVGAKTVVVRKVGKQVTLEIPSGSTADGGGAAIASGATNVPAAYRPSANISFPVVVTDNSALVFGKLVVSSGGQLSFSVGAAGGNFTDNFPAGFERISVTYTLP